MNKIKRVLDNIVTSLLASMWALTIITLTLAAFTFSLKLLLHLLGV